MGTSEAMIPAPLFPFEAPERNFPPAMQELQIGGAGVGNEAFLARHSRIKVGAALGWTGSFSGLKNCANYLIP
jgi:hypothetical protein